MFGILAFASVVSAFVVPKTPSSHLVGCATKHRVIDVLEEEDKTPTLMERMPLPMRRTIVATVATLGVGTGLLRWSGLAWPVAFWAATTSSCSAPLTNIARGVVCVVAVARVVILACFSRTLIDSHVVRMTKRWVSAVSLAHVALGMLVAQFFEGLSVAESLYLAVTTATTLGPGPGDVVPTTSAGTIAFALYSVLSAVAFTSIIGYFATAPIERARRRYLNSAFGDRLTPDLLRYLRDEVNDRGISRDPTSCSRAEFTLLTLVQLGLISPADLRAAQSRFNALDRDGTGVLSQRDLDLLDRDVDATVLEDFFDDEEEL